MESPIDEISGNLFYFSLFKLHAVIILILDISFGWVGTAPSEQSLVDVVLCVDIDSRRLCGVQNESRGLTRYAMPISSTSLLRTDLHTFFFHFFSHTEC